MTRRTAPSSGSITLVSHEYPVQAHQSMPRTSRPWAIPDQVGWWAISAVHWVIARTKTRSKKSSSGVTRSPSRSVALRSGPRASLPVAMALGVLGCVFRQQFLLAVLLREAEEDEGAAEQDRDDAGRVGPGVAVQERGLGRGDDL